MHATVLLLASLAATALAADVSSNLFGSRIAKGKATTYNLNYITGMAASRLHKDIVYMVTSDDRDNYLMAVDINTGVEIAWFNVTKTKGWDWEDLAYGPCQDDCMNGSCGVVGTAPSRYCIYIADIGSHGNDGAHDNIYMLREPTDLGPYNGTVYKNVISVVKTLTFTWGEPDAETLMVAPDARLFVVSKTAAGRAMIAEVPAVGWTSGHVELINESNTGILKTYTNYQDPQGGDISPGGNEMVIVCEAKVLYYSVANGDYINAVRTQVPESVATYVPVKDSEAITWAPDAGGFYTYAVGDNQLIYFYPRSPSAAPVGK